MPEKIALKVGLPVQVGGGSVKNQIITIRRDPPGSFLPDEYFEKTGETRSIVVEADDQTHVTIDVQAFNEQGQESNIVTKKVQATKTIAPVLRNEMSVELVDSPPEEPADTKTAAEPEADPPVESDADPPTE